MRGPASISTVLLAWLSALAAGDAIQFAVDPARPLPRSPGFHEIAVQVTAGKRSFRMPVGIFLPLAYFQAKEPLPVVVVLHNYGEKGHGGGDALKFEGLQMLLGRNLTVDPRMPGNIKAKVADPRKELRFVGLVPQCPGDLDWGGAPMNRVVPALAHEMARALRADGERCVLTGFSYGGTSTWLVALASPEAWAAIVPISARRPDPAPPRRRR